MVVLLVSLQSFILWRATILLLAIMLVLVIAVIHCGVSSRTTLHLWAYLLIMTAIATWSTIGAFVRYLKRKMMWGSIRSPLVIVSVIVTTVSDGGGFSSCVTLPLLVFLMARKVTTVQRAIVIMLIMSVIFGMGIVGGASHGHLLPLSMFLVFLKRIVLYIMYVTALFISNSTSIVGCADHTFMLPLTYIALYLTNIMPLVTAISGSILGFGGSSICGSMFGRRPRVLQRSARQAQIPATRVLHAKWRRRLPSVGVPRQLLCAAKVLSRGWRQSCRQPSFNVRLSF